MAGIDELELIRKCCEAALHTAYTHGLFEAGSWPDFEYWHVLETRILEPRRAAVLWADRRTHPIAIENMLIPAKVVEMRVDPHTGFWVFSGFIPPDDPGLDAVRPDA